jgi:hypothetical protein
MSRGGVMATHWAHYPKILVRFQASLNYFFKIIYLERRGQLKRNFIFFFVKVYFDYLLIWYEFDSGSEGMLAIVIMTHAYQMKIYFLF